MNTLAAGQPQALPAKPLIVLTSLVGLAHVLLLQATPLEWSAVPEPRATPRAFITRTLEIKPAAVTTPAPVPVPAAPAVRRAPAKTRAQAPSIQQNSAPAPSPPAPTATELIASTTPDTAPATDAPPPTPPAPAAQPQPPLAGASTALTIPGSVRLKYAMTGRSRNMDYSAFAELSWLQDGQSYDAKLVVSAFLVGSRSMSSSGHITADGLAPTRFLDKYRSERAAHFEADKGKISFSANTPDAPWLRGAQDRLSVFLQLGSLLAGDPASYPVGSKVSLYTAGPRDADTWIFTVEAEETLSLPAGEVPAIKLARKPQRDYDQTVEIWFAPSMEYLPVRSRITQQNGDFIDQKLRTAEKP
jgi:hypothetical protein